MNDTNLKKEFSKRDVQRMRNIISGNAGSATGVQVGYSKQQQDYQEGDVWEENGKQWTIKNGIKQTVTRFDELKKIINLPLACPNCGKAIKSNSLNKKMWAIHGKCFDCVISYETELKRQGKFEEYANSLVTGGVKQYIRDLEDALLDLPNDQNETFVTEQGDVEKWAGKGLDINKLAEEVQEHIQKLKDYVDK